MLRKVESGAGLDGPKQSVLNLFFLLAFLDTNHGLPKVIRKLW